MPDLGPPRARTGRRSRRASRVRRVSGVFGVVRFGALAPAPMGTAAAMAAAMAPWGDSTPTTADLQGGVVGHALRWETPEDAHTAMPVGVPQREVLITAEGRLDNRDNVAAGLGIPLADARTMADSTLIARAYLMWAEAACPRLYGDWSLAAWHPAEQRLVLARDHHGNTSISYHLDRASGRAVFASDPRALLAAGIPRRLNELHLAQVLVSWSGSDPDETIDLDIARVPPAHVAVLTPSGVRTTRYWQPPTHAESDGSTPEAYAERLLAALDEATRARCRSASPVATTLSGGLDSGSVTALAARSLHGSGGRLSAYTSVPIGDTSRSVGPARFGDESALAQATARAAGVDDHLLLDSATISPIAGMRRALDALDRPAHAASNAYWIQDVLLTTAAHGQGTLLTGQCGNATISWTGQSRTGRLRARWQQRGVAGVAGYLLPDSVHRHRVARALARSDWATSAIDPTFADRIHLADRMAASVGSGNLPLPRSTALASRRAILQPGSSRVGDVWSQNSAHAHVDVRDPTADPRVIEVTWAIPDALFRGPDGTDRWMLRTAMTGLLPEEVRVNRTRGRQSGDLVERLRRSAHEVDDAFAEVAGGPAEEYLSLARMRAAWDVAQRSDDAAATHRAGSILLRGMMAALWLQRTYG